MSDRKMILELQARVAELQARVEELDARNTHLEEEEDFAVEHAIRLAAETKELNERIATLARENARLRKALEADDE